MTHLFSGKHPVAHTPTLEEIWRATPKTQPRETDARVVGLGVNGALVYRHGSFPSYLRKCRMRVADPNDVFA